MNALHNVPGDVPSAVAAAEFASRLGQEHLGEGRLAQGIASLHRGVVLMERLFQYELTEAQLRRLRDQLEATVAALRGATRTVTDDGRA